MTEQTPSPTPSAPIERDWKAFGLFWLRMSGYLIVLFGFGLAAFWVRRHIGPHR